MDRLLIAVLLGLLQGVLEWLPVSSEGNVAIALSALGAAPGTAVAYGLFLHGGTAVSATVYFRGEFADLLRSVPEWRPDGAFEADAATLTFLVVATLASGVVGVASFLALESLVSALTGGAFVALVGALLVLTGVVQRVAGRDGGGEAPGSETGQDRSGETDEVSADARPDGGADDADFGDRTTPDAIDAVLVGALQGLAILPGVSRSGTTTSALLLRGYDGEAAFRLSFLLSVPAAVGAAGIAVVEQGGLPGVSPAAAVVALATAAVVGYATVDGLLRVVRRVAFWAVCVGLGGLTVVGGVLVVVV